MVIGASGGLDSTHALIVASKAWDRLDIPRSSILGYTMPGFATGEATQANAWALMRALGSRQQRSTSDRRLAACSLTLGIHSPKANLSMT